MSIHMLRCMDKIRESIQHWISFFEYASSLAQGSSHVIIVSSHADLSWAKEKNSPVEQQSK